MRHYLRKHQVDVDRHVNLDIWVT